MMETKHWAVLCALLLINFGSAEDDVVGTDPSEIDHVENTSQASVPTSVPAISHTMTSPSTNESHSTQSSRVTSSLSSNRTTAGTPVTPTTQSRTDDGSNTVSPVELTTPAKNLKTDHPTTQPPTFPSGSHRPTAQTPLTSTPSSTTLTSHFGPVDVNVISRQPTMTLNESALPLPDTMTQSNQPTPPKTHLHTPAPTPEPEAITTSHIAPSTSASSSSSSPSSASPLHVTSPQPERHPKTSSAPHQTSVQVHAGTPSQLNVGGDTTKILESPTLDPLLACLVSAFIITAIIITLLLFLKLRRRDNRPEFRRLQDLPMDDMMEDTPLSMYSY